MKKKENRHDSTQYTVATGILPQTDFSGTEKMGRLRFQPGPTG